MKGEKWQDWSSIWESYKETVSRGTSLVCVHPTYGIEHISVTEHDAYINALQEYWGTIAVPVIRILVSGGFKDEVLLRYILEPDIIIDAFPRNLNRSSVISPYTEVCGSTAKSNPSSPNGCVDNVSQLLTANNYTVQSKVVPTATFFPVYTE